MVRTHTDIIKNVHEWVLNNFPGTVVAPQLIKLPTHLELVLPGNKINKSTLSLPPAATVGSILPHLHTLCSELNLRMTGDVPKKLIINGVPTDL